MEARIIRLALLAGAILSLGASYRTENFIVTAPTPRLAKAIGDAAEQYRRELAIEWLGEEFRPWATPCPISANVAPDLGAGGATSFVFHEGHVFEWEMVIQGSEERILDSVLPHEVTHTIFATHFRQPLPRWADEGACTTVEHHTEKMRHQQLLIEFLKTGRGIPMDKMFAMTEYPRNKADILPLYSQAFSVARYMIQHGGKRKFIKFVEDGLASRDWGTATRNHYGHGDLANLQNQWLDWVRNGSPQMNPVGTPPNTAIASADRPAATSPTTFAAETQPVNPNGVAAAGFTTPEQRAFADAPPFRGATSSTPVATAPTAQANQPRPVNWQATPGRPAPAQPGATSTAGTQAVPAKTASTGPATGPPQRYQAVRQQPPQRPQQRVLR